MPILKSNYDNQIGMWDFATNGGAVGTYNIGIVLPIYNMMPSLTFLKTLPMISAGGLATISVGWVSLSFQPVLNFPAEFLGVELATAHLPALAFKGIHGEANPFRVNLAIEFTMTIGVEPLTNGNLIMYADYFNSDF